MEYTGRRLLGPGSYRSKCRIFSAGSSHHGGAVLRQQLATQRASATLAEACLTGPVTNQLQIKHRKRITLHLLTHMLPVFTTYIAYMRGMFFTCIFFFIQVSRVTMLTYNVSYSTPMLQRFDSSIDT